MNDCKNDKDGIYFLRSANNRPPLKQEKWKLLDNKFFNLAGIFTFNFSEVHSAW
jgi:hypothetical protein